MTNGAFSTVANRFDDQKRLLLRWFCHDGDVIEEKNGEAAIVTDVIRRQGYRSIKIDETMLIGFPQRRTNPRGYGFSTAPRLSERKTVRTGGLQSTIFPRRRSDPKGANNRRTAIAMVLSWHHHDDLGGRQHGV